MVSEPETLASCSLYPSEGERKVDQCVSQLGCSDKIPCKRQLKQDTDFPQSWRLGSLRPRCRQFGFW